MFYLELTKWDSEGLDVYINFTKPLVISKGIDQDQIICKIKNRKLFVSNETYEPLKSNRIYLSKTIPR